MKGIAFNTASLVARETGYHFSLNDWRQQHEITVKRTDEAVWSAICAEIREAGYTLVEVWAAHVDPSVTDENRARRFRSIMDEHSLTPIAIAGGLTPELARVAAWLGVDRLCGGLKGDIEQVNVTCQQHNVLGLYENHPEKTVDEIRQCVAGGSDHVGVCIDTGWLGSRGLDAPTTVRELGSLVRHVHIKDVKAVGGHETCPLGEGVVDLSGALTALKTIGFDGYFSWEDEPEDRNPMDIAEASRRWIEQRWSQA